MPSTLLSRRQGDILQNPYLHSVIGDVDKTHGPTNDVYLSVKIKERIMTRCISQETNYFSHIIDFYPKRGHNTIYF